MNPLTSKLSRGACVLVLALAGTSVSQAGGLVEFDFYTVGFGDPTTIDNMYWPLTPGTVFTYFAETEDGCEWNTVDVTYDDTKTVNGVPVVVVLDTEWLDESDDCAEVVYGFPDDEVTEFTYDWYAQDDLGNIWYLGEDTLSFDWDECDGTPVLTPPFGLGCPDGSFEAGIDGAEAGIVMLADPQKGNFYQQEYYEDQAEDWGKVLNFVELDDVECLKTKEWTPLEPGAVEHKYYCPDDGQDLPGLYLISELSGGPTVWVELLDIDTYPE